ncbi:MAG: SPOCS domain-containing protein [Clostridiaceae bacterium]
MELLKENIEFEKLVGENTANTMIKEEYIIPDSHPDIKDVIMVDVKPVVVSKEVLEDKVYVEGELNFNVIYLAEFDEKHDVFNVFYPSKFAAYIEIAGAISNMDALVDSFIEHIECKIVNERKVAIEGVLKVRGEVFNNEQYEIVKGITNVENTQVLNSPLSIDKVHDNIEKDLQAKGHFIIANDKPQIESIIKLEVLVHKKTVKVLDDKILLEGFANIKILYKAKDGRELVSVEDDVIISDEAESEGASPFMNVISNFNVVTIEYDVKEDDLGETRIIDVEALIKANVKLISKSDIESIEDAYSPNTNLNLVKKDRELTVVFGTGSIENIIKENLEIGEDSPTPTNVLLTLGKAEIMEKKVIEDKVLLEGIVKAASVYENNEDKNYIAAVEDEIPFTLSIDVPGAKVGMEASAKVNVETIDGTIEAKTIAIKALLAGEVVVKYSTHKEFIDDITISEAEDISKKASVIIYVVQNGDTLWKIAKKYNTTLEKLINTNDFNDTENLIPGEKIIIEGRAVI